MNARTTAGLEAGTTYIGLWSGGARAWTPARQPAWKPALHYIGLSSAQEERGRERPHDSRPGSRRYITSAKGGAHGQKNPPGQKKAGWGTRRIVSVWRYIQPGLFLFGDPSGHALMEDVEGERAGAQQFIVKCLDVVLRAEFLPGLLA